MKLRRENCPLFWDVGVNVSEHLLGPAFPWYSFDLISTIWLVYILSLFCPNLSLLFVCLFPFISLVSDCLTAIVCSYPFLINDHHLILVQISSTAYNSELLAHLLLLTLTHRPVLRPVKMRSL